MKALKVLLLVAMFLPLTVFAGMSTSAEKAERLHSFYIKKHHYVSDESKYGVLDKWVAELEGDCEDYALFMRKQFNKVGVESEMWIVRTETGERHMVLLVEGKLVDNRFDKVLDKADVDYKWIAKVPALHLEKY